MMLGNFMLLWTESTSMALSNLECCRYPTNIPCQVYIACWIWIWDATGASCSEPNVPYSVAVMDWCFKRLQVCSWSCYPCFVLASRHAMVIALCGLWMLLYYGTCNVQLGMPNQVRYCVKWFWLISLDCLGLRCCCRMMFSIGFAGLVQGCCGLVWWCASHELLGVL